MFFIVVFVVVTHDIPLFLTSRWLSRLVFGCFIVLLLFLHCCSPFCIVFAIECNRMIGSHAGGSLGSSQPSIQSHLLAATNIAANANVGHTAEKHMLVAHPKGTILATLWLKQMLVAQLKSTCWWCSQNEPS